MGLDISIFRLCDRNDPSDEIKIRYRKSELLNRYPEKKEIYDKLSVTEDNIECIYAKELPEAWWNNSMDKEKFYEHFDRVGNSIELKDLLKMKEFSAFPDQFQERMVDKFIEGESIIDWN